MSHFMFAAMRDIDIADLNQEAIAEASTIQENIEGLGV